MKENKSVGPNLKTYFYYTNEMADSSEAKAVIVIATGSEGSGSLYDEIGAYLDTKGYALYAIDEWQYGKTGKVVPKTSYKNWKKKDSYFAAYNIHALSVLAKKSHPNAPIYLIGNDFGAMLSLYLIKEFPEVVDKLVTVGWGMPTFGDYMRFVGAWIKKACLYDSGVSSSGHKSKNFKLSLHFERGNKYSWLSSDLEQVKKIVDAGYIDTAGTIGHYFYYYKRKILTPRFMRMKKCDRATPMLFLSGADDYTTARGRKTEGMAKHYKHRHFTNVETKIIEGRHQLMFETNKLQIMDLIINWLETGNLDNVYENEVKVEEVVTPVVEVIQPAIQSAEEVKPEKEPVKETPHVVYEQFKEADDELLLKSKKEGK